LAPSLSPKGTGATGPVHPVFDGPGILEDLTRHVQAFEASGRLPIKNSSQEEYDQNPVWRKYCQNVRRSKQEANFK
jgi:hypothetical protein